MRKLILTLGMVVILGLITVVPAFGSAPPEDAVKFEPDCFGKMASDQWPYGLDYFLGVSKR